MNTDKTVEEKFMEAYESYNDAIFRYCLIQTSNREKALDLTQDTFTKTWEYLAAGKQVDQIRAFLYKVATNLIIDDRRKKKAFSLDALTEEGFDITDTHEDVGEKVSAAFDGARAREALLLLEPKYRDVLTMRYVDDLSIEEIATATESTSNAVSVRIHRALEKLRSLVHE